MAFKREKAQGSPVLRVFGSQVKRFREMACLSQEAVGSKVPVSGSFIGSVERGESRCTRKLAAQLDEQLDARGTLVSLWDELVVNAAFPTWFDWPTVEQEAIVLEAYELGVVSGLAQTPAYASVILKGNKEAVAARMMRQEIFSRIDPEPPTFALLLDEGVLYRQVGTAEIMQEQLEHIISTISDRVTIQIVPARGEHAGNSGSFTLATLADRSEVGYVETAAKGLTMSDPDDLATMSKSLIELRSLALPVSMSIDLIRKAVSEKWT